MSPTPGADDLGFTLAPADDPELSADDELAGALDQADTLRAPEPDDEPMPFGMTWLFDFERGRFRRAGGSPMPVWGADSLKMWIQLCLHVAAGAHPCFAPEFGTYEPENVFGELADSEIAADFEKRWERALTQHDRITAVQDFESYYDPTQGVLVIENFNVILDDESQIAIGDIQIRPAVAG